ncbi:hypothetical protein M0812_29351 [Anaeramoeba flamelloides]|uniref:Uncharacterized protein n=1 Tax=Anaeramoeba flamelloides TaxID=1746091 RepID=A0AAV7Y4B9_9EUKA|nr:hypothetical protein M0812_29351 [Anaeramoeba flamelloides]
MYTSDQRKNNGKIIIQRKKKTVDMNCRSQRKPFCRCEKENQPPLEKKSITQMDYLDFDKIIRNKKVINLTSSSRFKAQKHKTLLESNRNENKNNDRKMKNSYFRRNSQMGIPKKKIKKRSNKNQKPFLKCEKKKNFFPNLPPISLPHFSISPSLVNQKYFENSNVLIFHELQKDKIDNQYLRKRTYRKTSLIGSQPNKSGFSKYYRSLTKKKKRSKFMKSSKLKTNQSGRCNPLSKICDLQFDPIENFHNK